MNTLTSLQPDTVQYQKVHDAVGLFDATSYFGRLLGKGRDVIDLLHRMSTNDLKPLEGQPGLGTQTVLTNEKGRIVDVLTLLTRKDDVLIVTSAGKEETVIQWLDKFTIMEDARFLPATATVSQFVVCGPRALDLFRQYTSEDLISLAPMNWISVEIGGYPVTLQKWFRIAESGWQVFADAEIAGDVRQVLEAAVLELGGGAIDREVFELLRIESGIPVTPNELNEKHNPLETTLVAAVNFKKGCYIGQEVIARLDSFDKVQRHMMGLVFEGRAADIASELASFVESDSDATATPALRILSNAPEQPEIGELTSYGYSPGMGKVIGLGFIRSAYSNPGATVLARLPGEVVLPAQLVKLPFDV